MTKLLVKTDTSNIGRSDFLMTKFELRMLQQKKFPLNLLRDKKVEMYMYERTNIYLIILD